MLSTTSFPSGKSRRDDRSPPSPSLGSAGAGSGSSDDDATASDRSAAGSGGEDGRSRCRWRCQGMSWLMGVSQRVDRGLTEFFRQEGLFVARHPYIVIVACVLITLMGIIPLIDKVAPGKGPIRFLQEQDKDNLYAPTNSQSLKDRDYVRKHYEEHLLTTVVLISRDQESDDLKNILTREHISEAWDIWNRIATIEVEYEGIYYQWGDVCARNKLFLGDEILPCKTFSILDAWDMNRTKFENDEDPLKTLSRRTVWSGPDASFQAIGRGAVNAYGAPVFRDMVVGVKAVSEDENGTLTAAEVFRFTLLKKNEKREIDGRYFDPVSALWEQTMADDLVFNWKGPLLKGYGGSFNEVDRASEAQVRKDFTWVILSFGSVIAVSHIVLFRNNRSFCKAHMSLISVLAITMAILTSMGVVNFMRIPYNLVAQTAPFLLVGLGMDDTFVLMGAYTSTPPFHSIEDRICETMMRAGTSIVVTSLTDFVAFSVGTFTAIPAVQAFCLYAAMGVFFDFFYQVTFFVAFMVLDARREERSKKGAPFFGLGSDPTKKEMTTWQATDPPSSQEMHKKGIEETGGEKIVNYTPTDKDPTYDKQVSFWEWKNQTGEMYPKCIGNGEFDPQSPSISKRLIGNYLPRLTLHPIGKAVVLMVEFIVLGTAIFGCTRVYMDFRYTSWFVPKDSWLHEAFSIEDQYFGGTQTDFHIYTKEPIDGKDYFDHLDELEALGKAMKESNYIADSPIPFSSWYDDFVLWSSFYRGHELVGGRPANASEFTRLVKEFLDAEGRIYLDNVVFSADGQRIKTSRMFAFTPAIGPMPDFIEIVDKVREEAEAAAPGLATMPYGFVFPFVDSFRVVTQETLKNVLFAGAAVFVICLLVLADLVTTLAVVLMIALTDVWLFGAMWYWGLHFNIVTSINIILAVGIAVDYSAHVAHSFLVVEGTRQERAQKALYHIGGEVFAGAMTTWLSVLSLAFAKHYIFTVFFKMFFIIVVAGLYHGIVVLPVVLSIIGSQSYATRAKVAG